jgi:hypothetical protein
MANSKGKSFINLILGILSLITVVCEDVFNAVDIHNKLIDRDNAHDPQPSISLLTKAETSTGFVHKGGIIKKDE